jgi:hypothetical protein
VAEGARLESVYTGNRIVGSNPTLSAKPQAALVRLCSDKTVIPAQSDVPMSTMQKKPQSFLDTFNSIFTTRLLVMIIASLLGAIAMRLLGFA